MSTATTGDIAKATQKRIDAQFFFRDLAARSLSLQAQEGGDFPAEDLGRITEYITLNREDLQGKLLEALAKSRQTEAR